MRLYRDASPIFTGQALLTENTRGLSAHKAHGPENPS